LLKSIPARVVTLFLILQGAILYSSVRHENIPPSRPLAELPKSLGAWDFVEEGVVDQDSRDVLKADDLLLRTYREPSTRAEASLFVAAFRSQRNGKAPHSPKNCLPGSGWTPLVQDEYQIDVGAAEPIRVNRYVVQHADQRMLVMYWYQSRDRVVANEYSAKYYVMVDAIRLNRTDTALVRVMVPMSSSDEEVATRTAAQFVKAFFGPLHQYLPA
jgi:EpsI family protein